MITVFNRRELIITYDAKVQANVREMLVSADVDYIIIARNIHPYSLNLRSHEYKIYVHKKDYAYACHLIRDVLR
ncbi:MAG: hypothetical protein IJC78_08255 [Clostridia bacterium]|nr:hypothetical protein [Clostridia bacterium]